MSHKPAKPIQDQIRKIIETRKSRLLKEIEEFEEKRQDADYYYGLDGGPSLRYQACIKTREQELEELEALAKGYGGPVQTTVKMTRYSYRCQCGGIIETGSALSGEWVDCPFCRGGINTATESKRERTVIVPPKPSWETDLEAWQKSFT